MSSTSTATGEQFQQDKLKYIQMCAIRSALKLEVLGMKRSRSPSAYSLAKKKFGLKGNRESVLSQLEELCIKERERQEEAYQNVHVFNRANRSN